MKRVYFIRPVGMQGPVKIGFTKTLVRRFREIDANSTVPLEIAASMEGGRALELRFHAKFAAQHLRFEWFNWSEEMEQTISAVTAGTLDVDALPAPFGLVQSIAAKALALRRAA